MPETVNVRGNSDSLYEAMTKEQILAAIVEAVEGGIISDVNTGFVTTIKEQNNGVGLMFWVGTTAQYNALAEHENNVLYIKTDDTSAQAINSAIAALQETATSQGGSISTILTTLASVKSVTDAIEFVEDAEDPTLTLKQIFEKYASKNYVQYSLTSCSTPIYPENVTPQAQSSNNVIVTLESNYGNGKFIWSHNSDIYACNIYPSIGGYTVTAWKKLSNT